MLQRPEIGSWEHIKLWVADKPQKEKFNWPNREDCAAAQYCLEHYGHCVYAGYGKLVNLSQLSGKVIDRRARAGDTDVWVSWGELYEAMS